MPFVGTPKNINEIEKENTYRPTQQLKPFMETEILVYIWFPLNAAFIDWKSARAFSCAVYLHHRMCQFCRLFCDTDAAFSKAKPNFMYAKWVSIIHM